MARRDDAPRPLLLDGLNPGQRAAVEAVRGPVCILAGAGSGKTTTLTRRIANQIASGAFEASQVLALTFTDRAANELKQRLKHLGTAGEVRARTFHAEALAQVAHFAGSPQIIGSKAAIIGPLVRKLPAPYRFKATKDVAGEIERAKNRRVTPDTYLDTLGDHEPVLPPEIMAGIFRAYEQRKKALDFEDLLEHAIRAMERPEVAERVRAKYHALSVDEYQDVNLLQQTLLESWLGGRDELCVVGDDYQSIYGFTGASPSWLTDFEKRYPRANVVTLTKNYRSTPQVLHVANRLTTGLGGPAKILEATKPEAGDCTLSAYATDEAETQAIVAEIDRLAASGVPFEEMAILYRINARSEDYEEALAAARIPYQVKDGAFLARPGPRAALQRGTHTVEEVCRALGWDPDAEPEGQEEITRHADLSRLVALAEEFDGTTHEFLADLRKRFEDDAEARGVVLSTYHRAKGLEWDAVFLPRLEEREMPFALSKSDEAVAEERRLLYVAITRARTHLRLSWVREREGKNTKPSRFLREINPSQKASPSRKAEPADSELFDRLREWRRRTAREMDVPPYVVFHDATLREICERRPLTLADLSRISGVGPAKLDRYGADVLDVVVTSRRC
jgi:DNA helicase-2/ATP-dependent DNA helicase PcrA